jgi:protein kinase-like protein
MVESDGWVELAAGDEFAGYRIESRLGRGGMGILYLALEPGLGRRVALKLIAPEAAADEVFARRFAEESRIAASIEHPNVVPIYAAGEEEGVPWIAMRFVAGSDLGRRIAREGKLEPAEAVALIAQVGNGLDAIHAAGLVHRDVKPANVLLSGDAGAQHAYITDFGVARNVATESGLTQTGRFVGTLDYVAPEQISGESVDARVDVYALGCLLYKLLTGEVPFPREGEAARLYAHLHDPPPAPSLYVPDLPIALDDVVLRALSKLPDDRFPSAGDLGRAAQAALSGTAVTIPERTVATGAAATLEMREPHRSKRPLLVAGGLALAIAAVLAVILASGGGGDETTGAGIGTEVTAKEARAEGQQRLTEAQLIAKGDAICADSRESYKRVFDPVLEEVPDVAYSKQLVANSTEAVREFNALRPPRSLERAYEKYVGSREQVNQWDRDALRAAEAGDEAAYREAREDRNDTEDDRKVLAEEVGFRECSGSDL